jgi:hypothetical protein
MSAWFEVAPVFTFPNEMVVCDKDKMGCVDEAVLAPPDPQAV